MHKLRHVALALVAFAGIQAFTGPCGCDSDAWLSFHGYTPLKPPSNLMQPGAIVAITHRRPFRAALICGPRASLGADWSPQESPTANQATSKMEGSSFKMEATFLESIKADARFEAVESITTTLTRARIVELRDEDVVMNVKNRSPECAAAIHARLARGYRITMISSALSGDATHNVRFSKDAHLEGRAKLDVMDQLAVELGGGVTSVSERDIRATDLVWGIRDDTYLVSIGLPDEILPTPDDHVPDLQRELQDRAVARILPIPDAPVVMPQNFRPSLDGFEDEQEQEALVRKYRQPTLPPVEGARIYDPRMAPSRRLPRNYIYQPDDQQPPERGRSTSL